MVTWTQTQTRSADGNSVQTRNEVALGFWAWSAAWVAATGSIGSFAVNLTRALGWWH
jgi:hypothetical protein